MDTDGWKPSAHKDGNPPVGPGCPRTEHGGRARSLHPQCWHRESILTSLYPRKGKTPGSIPLSQPPPPSPCPPLSPTSIPWLFTRYTASSHVPFTGSYAEVFGKSLSLPLSLPSTTPATRTAPSADPPGTAALSTPCSARAEEAQNYILIREVIKEREIEGSCVPEPKTKAFGNRAWEKSCGLESPLKQVGTPCSYWCCYPYH